MKSRTWARGVTTSYSYNNAGDLGGVDYSDSTPDVTYTYDRRGRQSTTAQSGGTTTTRTYNDASLLLRETYSGGPLNGIGVTNVYDLMLRRTNAATVGSSTAYGYDDASRLETVISGIHSAIYTYLANSPLVDNIVFATNGTTVMTTTKGYDALNRLTNIVSSGTGFQPVSYAYQYNSANQRTAITNSDNARWVYQYDSLGQVISGKKYWSDGTPVAGQQFEYAFDDIGNRRSTKAGGDNSGANLRPASYLNNSLNQILSREVPGYVNVLGTASNAATVTLWGDNGAYAATVRKGEYFRGELYANNATGAVWLTITNVAVLNNGANPDIVTNQTGKVLLSKTPETFSYDLDGNLTSDGLWTNVWNGENRRVTIEGGAGVPPAARMREQWTHLADGRWIQRIVSTNNGSAYYPAYTNRYVWDGQVLLAVLDHTNGLVMSFMRGLDLSGSLQGAGGVGGVLAVSFKTNGTHFCAYDGNGNVTALVSATSGGESARYEYGPFAETIRVTGPMAKLNPIRFSTQYADDVTGDVKYLFRDYDADTGRWPNRDPINERGGRNLYGFVYNNPVGRIDRLGLQVSGGYPGTPFFTPPENEKCCDDECEKEGLIDHFNTITTIIPAPWDLNTPDVIKNIKRAIKAGCRGRSRYAKDPTSVTLDLVEQFGRQHLEDTEGVRLFTILNYRQCEKGKCRKFLGSIFGGKCSPLNWSSSKATEPRECKPLPGEQHWYNQNAFASREVANAATSRCADEHAHEIWVFEE